ncbi:MAG: hypothetical protein JEZ07_04845 [Phycisphaerae bacterium]|nr:hypothetical protein [Phycisphaerae bacterium]
MTKRVKLLITGFEPFRHHKINTSWQAANHIGQLFDDVVAVELPVEYVAAHDKLIESLEKYKPDSCLCMGLAEGTEFRLEKMARKPKELSQFAGEEKHFSTWPLEAMGEVLTGLKSNWRYSEDCGQYVCESTLWTLLQYKFEKENLEHATFLHVPSVSDEYSIQRINDNVQAIVKQYLKI